MPQARLPVALLAICLASLAIPILAVGIPQALDYPNHLVRIWLLGGGIAQPPLDSIYRLDWDALTNIGIDLLAIPLARIMPAERVGQLYLFLGAALPVLGMAALHRRLYGTLGWWAVGFGICAWNLTLLAGFLNFNIGLGLALLATATDGRVGRLGPVGGFVLRIAIGFALGVMHAFALFLWAAALCGLAFGPYWRGQLWPRLRPVVLAGLPAVAALVLLVVLAPALPGAHETSNALTLRETVLESLKLLAQPGRKLRNGLAAIQTWRLKPDLLALLFLLVPLGAALAWGRVRAHAGLLLVALAMLALFIPIPDFAIGTGWLDRRFAQFAFILAVVALRPDLPRRFAPALACALAAMVLARSAWVGAVWWVRDADTQSVARALQDVPPGAAILPLEHSAPAYMLPLGRNFMDGFPAYYHLPTLAVMWRHAFVPTVFTARGKQPLAVRPPWDRLAVPEGPVASVTALTMESTASWAALWSPYLRQWHRFDYALVLNAELPDQYGPITLPPEFELVRDEGFAQLWRIRRAAPSASAK